jgi:type VI secretion system secreted protein Hcp
MAAVDYFLKIDGIDGEAQDSKHKNEIDIESWSFGATNSGTMSSAGGGGAGKVKFDDFHFVMKVNKSSPKLMLACASGEHIKKAVLTCRKAGKDQQEFLKYTFSDCIVSSFQQGGSSEGQIIPTDQITLNFAKIEKEYKAQKQDGTLDGAIKSGWDLKQNVKV